MNEKSWQNGLRLVYFKLIVIYRNEVQCPKPVFVCAQKLIAFHQDNNKMEQLKMMAKVCSYWHTKVSILFSEKKACYKNHFPPIGGGR